VVPSQIATDRGGSARVGTDRAGTAGRGILADQSRT
jgi:hypothetical protein